jgi:DNA-binding transcriptional MerR regulator
VKPSQTRRLITIGEFAAATQLSAKALRLYDEQGILRPLHVDPGNGYRYYGTQQVGTGRLIRTLRDMDLPLSGIQDIVRSDLATAEHLLRLFAEDNDRDHARRKRALHRSLSLLRGSAVHEPAPITERARLARLLVVRAFLADRNTLVRRFYAEVAAGQREIEQANLHVAADTRPCCILREPVSDDEGRFEAALAIDLPSSLPPGVSVQQIPAATCAVFVGRSCDSDLQAGLDALFDWFDRRGLRSIDPPHLYLHSVDAGLQFELEWAYESTPASGVAR